MKLLIAALIILLLVLQYKLWIDEDGLPDIRRLQKELQQQRVENERLQMRNRALQAEVQDLKKGLAAIEEMARKDLGMIREGETFFQIIKKPNPAEQSPDSSAGSSSAGQ